MEIQIIETLENPLLRRKEVKFCIEDVSTTPNRVGVKEKIAALHNSDFDLVFVKIINTRFGSTVNTGLATIYEDAEAAAIEPLYVKIRNMKSEDREEARKTLTKPKKKKKK